MAKKGNKKQLTVIAEQQVIPEIVPETILESFLYDMDSLSKIKINTSKVMLVMKNKKHEIGMLANNNDSKVTLTYFLNGKIQEQKIVSLNELVSYIRK